MRQLFADDAERFADFSRQAEGILLDFSKNRLTGETLALLLDLARESGVEDWRDRLLAGEVVNQTEARPAAHVGLRAPGGNPDLDRLKNTVEAVRSGRRTGATGEAIRAVVSIGIGGSHTGPMMAAEALKLAADGEGPDVRFVANLDAADLRLALAGLQPQTTLFIAASKSFTTEETLANAELAKAWLADELGGEAAAHFLAVTGNASAAADFGVAEDDTFDLPAGVGGRYSLTSNVGLAVAMAVGAEAFDGLLAGAHAMDRHFAEAPLADNLPVVLALVGVWNINFLGYRALAVLPYAHRLRHLPAHLQQLEMESNGKGVGRDGHAVEVATAPVVFGEAGTLGQHAFHQLLHQGPDPVPADFIAFANAEAGEDDNHDRLLANFLAQADSLMTGRDNDAEPHRRFPGNRPSNTIVAERLDAATLGRLVALYEHKVFVQGVIWGINPFDQWGVELGKELSRDILPRLRDAAGANEDGMVGHVKSLREKGR